MNYALLLIAVIIFIVFILLVVKPEILGLQNNYAQSVKDNTDNFIKSIPQSKEFVQYSTPLLNVVKVS